VLRADLEQKVWVVKGDQWEPGLRALDGMTQALPAVIEPTSNTYTPTGSRHQERKQLGTCGTGALLTLVSTR